MINEAVETPLSLSKDPPANTTAAATARRKRPHDDLVSALLSDGGETGAERKTKAAKVKEKKKLRWKPDSELVSIKLIYKSIEEEDSSQSGLSHQQEGEILRSKGPRSLVDWYEPIFLVIPKEYLERIVVNSVQTLEQGEDANKEFDEIPNELIEEVQYDRTGLREETAPIGEPYIPDEYEYLLEQQQAQQQETFQNSWGDPYNGHVYGEHPAANHFEGSHDKEGNGYDSRRRDSQVERDFSSIEHDNHWHSEEASSRRDSSEHGHLPAPRGIKSGNDASLTNPYPPSRHSESDRNRNRDRDHYQRRPSYEYQPRPSDEKSRRDNDYVERDSGYSNRERGGRTNREQGSSTTICKSYRKPGGCKFGSHCRYLHM